MSDLDATLDLLTRFDYEPPAAVRDEHEIATALAQLAYDPPRAETDLIDAYRAGKITPANLTSTMTKIANRASVASTMLDGARRVSKMATDRAHAALVEHADDIITALRPAFAARLESLRACGVEYTASVTVLARTDPATVGTLTELESDLDALLELHERLVPLANEPHALTARIVPPGAITWTGRRVLHMGSYYVDAEQHGGRPVDPDLIGDVPAASWLMLDATWPGLVTLNLPAEAQSIMIAEVAARDAAHSGAPVTGPGLVPDAETEAYVARMSRNYERATQPA